MTGSLPARWNLNHGRREHRGIECGTMTSISVILRSLIPARYKAALPVKIALGRHLDGRVSAVVGTHTHVQTADEQIFPGGTAFLCDAGMCGAADSILGRTKESILRRFLTGMPTVLPVATGAVEICGVVVDVDEATGQATAIRRIREILAA